MTNSALLPGEHPGIENAIAHRDDIVKAAWASAIFEDQQITASYRMTAAQREFLTDLGWNAALPSVDQPWEDLRDNLREWIDSQALSVQLRSAWYAQGTELEPDEFRIVLSVGGPNLTLEGELDRYGSPCTACLRYSWYSKSEVLPVIESEAEALVWFAQQFVQA